MDSMRRAYQKAITIPLNNVEHLWKEYDQWENNLNRLTVTLGNTYDFVFKLANYFRGCKGQEVLGREVFCLYDSAFSLTGNEILDREP